MRAPIRPRPGDVPGPQAAVALTPASPTTEPEPEIPTSTTAAVQVTYVTAPACHHCDHGRTVLAELARHVPLDVREVSLGSDEGRQLLAVHRFAFPPAVIVDGRLVAHGRLSARRLARLLPLEVG
jgi:hypothetical protein